MSASICTHFGSPFRRFASRIPSPVRRLSHRARSSFADLDDPSLYTSACDLVSAATKLVASASKPTTSEERVELPAAVEYLDACKALFAACNAPSSALAVALDSGSSHRLPVTATSSVSWSTLVTPAPRPRCPGALINVKSNLVVLRWAQTVASPDKPSTPSTPSTPSAALALNSSPRAKPACRTLTLSSSTSSLRTGFCSSPSSTSSTTSSSRATTPSSNTTAPATPARTIVRAKVDPLCSHPRRRRTPSSLSSSSSPSAKQMPRMVSASPKRRWTC